MWNKNILKVSGGKTSEVHVAVNVKCVHVDIACKQFCMSTLNTVTILNNTCGVPNEIDYIISIKPTLLFTWKKMTLTLRWFTYVVHLELQTLAEIDPRGSISTYLYVHVYPSRTMFYKRARSRFKNALILITIIYWLKSITMN